MTPDFNQESGRTAIARSKISPATRSLISSGRLPRSASVLNHGCGMASADSAALANAAAQYAEYDPHHAPNTEALERRYDVVVSNFVINVLPPEERKTAWEDIARATGGVAYVSVRSTGDKDSYTSQRHKDGYIRDDMFFKPYTAEGLKREASKYFKSVEIISGREGGIHWTVAASNSKIAGPGEPETPGMRVVPPSPEKEEAQANAQDDWELNDIKRLAGIS